MISHLVAASMAHYGALQSPPPKQKPPLPLATGGARDDGRPELDLARTPF
jgi:hypothetical protein